jgi:hypothetical protein
MVFTRLYTLPNWQHRWLECHTPRLTSLCRIWSLFWPKWGQFREMEGSKTRFRGPNFRRFIFQLQVSILETGLPEIHSRNPFQKTGRPDSHFRNWTSGVPNSSSRVPTHQPRSRISMSKTRTSRYPDRCRTFWIGAYGILAWVDWTDPTSKRSEAVSADNGRWGHLLYEICHRWHCHRRRESYQRKALGIQKGINVKQYMARVFHRVVVVGP